MLRGKGKGVASAGRETATDGLLRKRHTGIADEDAGSCDKLVGLLLSSPAESAYQIVPGVARSPNPTPPTAAGAFHHLLYALMAQFERMGKLPQGAACQVHSTDDGVIFGTRQLNLMFRVSECGPCSASFFQQQVIDGHRAPSNVYCY
jgi:hypothetical protein